MPDALLATTFRFRVSLTKDQGPDDSPERIGDGAFQECSGLDVELEVSEYMEGGRNDAVVQRAGRAKYPRIVLKRGMFHAPGETVDAALWTWIRDVVTGVRPLRRYNGRIEVMGAAESIVASWEFRRGLPAKVVGPQLNARTGEVAMEELHIAHEGLALVKTQAPS